MRIIMTGATGGFGLFAAERLIAAGHRLTIGARDVRNLPPGLAGKVDVHPLDLDQLAAVRRFADVTAIAAPIDVLILNAGLQLAKPALSHDGFERTFAVNHLAHFLLLNLLRPSLAPGARVILTASGTHDPALGTPVTPPVHANAEWLAYPERDPAPETKMRNTCFRAYSSSKLANVMTARELARRHPDLSAMSYDPGYVPWTGLGRDNGRLIAAIASMVIPRMMARDRSSTVPRSGKFLAALATDPRAAHCHGDYWSVIGRELVLSQPSELARDDAAAAKLWDDSARLVRLDTANDQAVNVVRR